MKARLVLGVLGLVLAFYISPAQNYKASKIDASGKITDGNGKLLGTLTREGVVHDASGKKIASVDAEGNLVDAVTGKKLGKSEKNGNFIAQFAKTPDEGWTTSAPMNGTCLIKDKDGKVRAEVHENYKQFGACAIHCLTRHMKHGEVGEDKKVVAAAYSCPMHPEVTSDKPANCSKCGMALTKGGK